MNSLIRKSLDAVRQYKFGLFNIILNRLFPETISYQNYILYKYHLEEPIADSSSATESVTIKKVENAEDELFQKFREKFPAAEFLSRIKNSNQTAFIATENGEIAGYSWVAEKELFIESLNHKFTLKDDEIYVYACFVPRDNRGKGIYPAMLHTILKSYRERNIRLAFIGVLAANKGSIKGIEKAGFVKQRQIKYLKIFDYEKWWGRECSSGHTTGNDIETNPQFVETQKAG